MIALEPLASHHIEHYPAPLDGFPLDFWRGKAVVAVDDGVVIGICCLRQVGKVVVASLLATDELRRHPIFLHRTVVYGINGLRAMGIDTVQATAETETSAKWLKRLGFERIGKWYVKCLAPKPS